MSKQKIIWKHFEAIYIASFQASIFHFQVILDEHKDTLPDKKLKQWHTQIESVLKNNKSTIKQITQELTNTKDTSTNNFLSKVFQIYCYAVCTQYTLAKMRIQILKMKDAIVQWKEAPIYEGGFEDNTLRIFNDIYRKCTKADKHLFEIRKRLVKLGRPVPKAILSAMNKKICARKDGSTLKYRLWNMLRFFKSLGTNEDVELEMCPVNQRDNTIKLNFSNNLHWSEQVFTHKVRTTGKVTSKPYFTAKSIVINNGDSPLVYQNTNPDEAFNLRERTKKNIQYMLRESHNYNQHGLTHIYDVTPADRSRALELVNQLDKNMDKLSEKELEDSKKGITEWNVRNPLKYVKKVKTNLKHHPISIVKTNSNNKKYSIWIRNIIDGKSCYWRVCDKAGLIEWDDLSDIPNYLGIANQLKKGVIDGGFLFNKYMETWDSINRA